MAWDAETYLPNYTIAKKCCANCKHCKIDFDGFGKCGILLSLNIDDIVIPTVYLWRVCDLWEKN